MRASDRCLVDSDVFTCAARGHQWAIELLNNIERCDPAISSITIFELARSLEAEQHERIAAHITRCRVIALDDEVARQAADYCRVTADEGYRVDYFAGIIAASAARTDRSLVTVNPARYPLAPCRLIPANALADGAPEPRDIQRIPLVELTANPSDAPGRVRSGVDVRAVATREQTAAGRWRCRFDALELEAEGDSEDEAMQSLERLTFESLAASAHQRLRFQRFAQDHGEHGSVDEGELSSARAAVYGMERLTDANLGAAIDDPTPLLIDCWSLRCVPCRQMSRWLKDFAAERGGVRLMLLDVEAHPDIAARLDVLTLPTVLLFSEGAERARLVGLGAHADLGQAFGPHLP